MFAELLQTCTERYGSSDTSVDLAQWICDNTTINKRPFNFSQYPFQEEIARDEHLNLSCEKCSQVGLALALDTPIPTPTGWSTMGDLERGDHVFDDEGKPTRVTYTSPVYYDHPCYEITFDDGETITADENHRWYVEVDRSFDLSGRYSGRGRPSSDCLMFKSGILKTSDLYKYQHANGRNQFAIPNTQPLMLPEADLPIDPYYLGVWLGDGNTHASVFTSHRPDASFVSAALHERGFACETSYEQEDVLQIGVRFPNQKRPGRGVPCSPSWTLKQMGLLGKRKFIPSEYLRASERQRLELLRGLLDTDGSITPKGRVSFYNTNPELITGTVELAHSLGLKTRTRWRGPSKSGFVGKLPIGEVSFVAYDDHAVFNLPRKLERLRSRKDGRPSEALRRRIVSVTPVQSQPVRCITVNSPSHLYLAGVGMVPTHNTEIQIRKFFAMLRRGTSLSGIFTLPNEKMYKRVYNARMKPLLDQDLVFNPPMGTPPVRNMGMVQIMDSFGYITGCTEGDATSISADFVMHDELDLSPADMIGLFQSRLQNSDLKMTQAFSTPTFLDFGINRQYQLSDQREYMLQCEACNHWQIPRFDFPFLFIPGLVCEVDKITDLTAEQISDLDLDGVYVRCEKCQQRLDLGDAGRREWVATYPTRTTGRGYKVRPFSTSRISPGYIFNQLSKYHQQNFLRGFYNTVLGEPFADSSAQIQRHEIEKVMAPTGNVPNVGKDRPVFLGLDVGQICHLSLHTIGEDERPEFILFEQIPVFQLPQRLQELRQIYGIVQGCADRYPYTPMVDSFRDETAGLIMPVHYGGRSYLVPHRDELGGIDYYVANRTAALDRVHFSISNEQVVIAGYGSYRETLITHLRDMVRDDRPGAEPEWKKSPTGNDHFFHSMALSILARRVCEHVYLNEPKSLLSTVIVSGLKLPTTSSNLQGEGGAARISKLGGFK